MALSLLFVCLGNICRSPAAEGVMRVKAAEAGLDLTLDSCGTGRWHIGEPPYAPMQKAAAARGYSLDTLRARVLTSDDFRRFDLLLAMDRDNLADLHRLRPADATARTALFLSEGPHQDVPDPYYTRGFDEALDLIETGADRLVADIRNAQRAGHNPLDW